jgi:hypothetical protein
LAQHQGFRSSSVSLARQVEIFLAALLEYVSEDSDSVVGGSKGIRAGSLDGVEIAAQAVSSRASTISISTNATLAHGPQEISLVCASLALLLQSPCV